MSSLRQEIVNIVQTFCDKNKLEYRETWRQIYKAYGEAYHIYPDIWYKFGSLSKLDFLEGYEALYGTLTKLYILIKDLK
jgi:hypothetical protein